MTIAPLHTKTLAKDCPPVFLANRVSTKTLTPSKRPPSHKKRTAATKTNTMVSLKRALPVDSSHDNTKRQCVRKSVRFSTSYTERTAENYLSGLDQTHEDALRAQLWYNVSPISSDRGTHGVH